METLAHPPLHHWATNLHIRTELFQGVLLAGLEGCRAYNPGKPYQYTEADVKLQVFRLGRRLLLNRIRYGRYLDILLTHAPPAASTTLKTCPIKASRHIWDFCGAFARADDPWPSARLQPQRDNGNGL